MSPNSPRQSVNYLREAADEEVFVWSDCQQDLGIEVLFGNMVFVGDAWYLAVYI